MICKSLDPGAGLRSMSSFYSYHPIAQRGNWRAQGGPANSQLAIFTKHLPSAGDCCEHFICSNTIGCMVVSPPDGETEARSTAEAFQAHRAGSRESWP